MSSRHLPIGCGYNRCIIATIATIESPPQQVRLGWGDAAVGKRIQRGGGAHTLWLRIVATGYAARQTRDTHVTLLDCVVTWKRSGGQALRLSGWGLQTCPLSSQVNADMQIHINGDVMMAIKQYLYATGDLLWLEHEGAPHPPVRVCVRDHAPTYSYSVPPCRSRPLPCSPSRCLRPFCSFLMAASRAASLPPMETAR